ncbi:MAG: hypothetical protein HY830_06310 [Actinobacteria bacterium]|nr:hypothetical protein [Actinomycetota bacterium]
MRLGRLVAAGLVAGAVAGFVGALLRPRTVPAYGSGPGPGAPGVATEVAPTATPHRRLDVDAAHEGPPDHAVAAAARSRGAAG